MRMIGSHTSAGRVLLGRVDIAAEQAAMCGTRCLPPGSRTRPAPDPLRSRRPDRSRRARPSAAQADAIAVRTAALVAAGVAVLSALAALAGCAL